MNGGECGGGVRENDGGDFRSFVILGTGLVVAVGCTRSSRRGAMRSGNVVDEFRRGRCGWSRSRFGMDGGWRVSEPWARGERVPSIRLWKARKLLVLGIGLVGGLMLGLVGVGVGV